MYSQQRESDCSAWAAATTTPSPLHAQTLGMTLQQEDRRALRRKIEVIKIIKNESTQKLILFGYFFYGKKIILGLIRRPVNSAFGSLNKQ